MLLQATVYSVERPGRRWVYRHWWAAQGRHTRQTSLLDASKSCRADSWQLLTNFNATRTCEIKQVHLLTPMDRATLPHAKSPMLPARQVKSPGSNAAIFKAHCYTDRQLSVISTCIHGKAQTPLGRFVVDVTYKQVCNKHTRSRTDGAWALVHRQRRRWEKHSGPSSTILLISVNGVLWRNNFEVHSRELESLVILRLAELIQYQSVTDTQTDRQTHDDGA